MSSSRIHVTLTCVNRFPAPPLSPEEREIVQRFESAPDGLAEIVCTLPTYLSWGIDGDDGPWIERAECDGPNGCGWSRDLDGAPSPLAGGINSVEFAALHTAHQYGGA